MSRNQERVLSSAMILDIKSYMFNDLEQRDERNEFVNSIMNAYLTNDWDLLKQVITENIEHYEDDILLTLNMELKEESHDNVNI
jgi:hypothetical protein